jgi:hypothetical protein
MYDVGTKREACSSGSLVCMPTVRAVQDYTTEQHRRRILKHKNIGHWPHRRERSIVYDTKVLTSPFFSIYHIL